MIQQFKRTLPKPTVAKRIEPVSPSFCLRPWHEILAEAQLATPENISINDLLDSSEIQEVFKRHTQLENQFRKLNALIPDDYMIAGIAGVLGGLIDIFLVQVPAHASFMGKKASKGGVLSNWVKDQFGQILPDDKIRQLEANFKVPFDASHSGGLNKPIFGLNPRTHRFQTLGHDPLLAWIFGVRDILSGGLTAIDKNGKLIYQNTQAPFMQGKELFTRIFQAIRPVGGHLLSDVNTKSGIPAPLMPLLQFIQVGSIGEKGYTVGEISQQMYRSGYDFRHFLAGMIPVLLIEVIVRIVYFAREIHQGASLKEAVPIGNHAKLHNILFLAHGVAAGMNAGKVIVTKNPLSISGAQWLAFFKYLIPQLIFSFKKSDTKCSKYIQQAILEDFQSMERDFARTWKATFSEYKPAKL